MNGALTIGTLDGANIEIRDAVGAEHFFLFGLTAEQVAERQGSYHPRGIYERNPLVRRALNAIAGGEFNPAQPDLFRSVLSWLTLERDPYLLLADFDSYVAAQRDADAKWRDPAAWTRAAILNIARIGPFSSDRAVREYAEHIWNVTPVPIQLSAPQGAT
jgi:starch phosphorylase